MTHMLKRTLWPANGRAVVGPLLSRGSLRTHSEVSRNTIIDPTINLDSEQRQLQQISYAFAVNEMRPHMREWDEKEYFPKETLRRAAQLGFGEPETGLRV